MPVVFINCSLFPFIDWILSGKKVYETRNRNTLKQLIGKRVWICETGKNGRIIKGSAIIRDVIRIDTRDNYIGLRKFACIRKGCIFDWKRETRHKYFYLLENVIPCVPFVPENGYMHGYAYMDSKYFID